MRLALTGTPGTGKTAVSKLLSARLKLKLIHLNEYAIKYGWTLGRDAERDSTIIDMTKLKNHSWPDNCLIEGHLAHELPVDKIIVLRTHPVELEKRLKKKAWSPEKIAENLEAEAMGLIADEAEPAVQIDTTGKIASQVVDEIEALLKGKLESSSYDFTSWF
ncbi:MAG: AAA family ATPase [Candidatus Altiarchaeota archaeon]|nr:AAA family ATPase [Candidatus Altiarchaeota archaeon]